MPGLFIKRHTLLFIARNKSSLLPQEAMHYVTLTMKHLSILQNMARVPTHTQSNPTS